MKSCTRTCSWNFVVVTSLILGACRTVQSSESLSLPIPHDGSLKLETWIPACEAELANPVTGASSRQELLALAKTDNCSVAFPMIQKLVDSLTSRP